MSIDYAMALPQGGRAASPDAIQIHRRGVGGRCTKTWAAAIPSTKSSILPKRLLTTAS